MPYGKARLSIKAPIDGRILLYLNVSGLLYLDDDIHMEPYANIGSHMGLMELYKVHHIMLIFLSRTCAGLYLFKY